MILSSAVQCSCHRDRSCDDSSLPDSLIPAWEAAEVQGRQQQGLAEETDKAVGFLFSPPAIRRADGETGPSGVVKGAEEGKGNGTSLQLPGVTCGWIQIGRVGLQTAVCGLNLLHVFPPSLLPSFC